MFYVTKVFRNLLLHLGNTYVPSQTKNRIAPHSILCIHFNTFSWIVSDLNKTLFGSQYQEVKPEKRFRFLMLRILVVRSQKSLKIVEFLTRFLRSLDPGFSQLFEILTKLSTFNKIGEISKNDAGKFVDVLLQASTESRVEAPDWMNSGLRPPVVYYVLSKRNF